MSLCQHCITLHKLSGTPTGFKCVVGDVETYIAKGSKKGSVVIATDFYGIGIPNAMILADQIAHLAGYTVYVPQLFPGGPLELGEFELPSNANQGPIAHHVMKRNIENFTKWISQNNSPSDTFPRYKSVILKASKEGPVVGLGYCYGAKLACLASSEQLVEAVALYHPSLLEADDTKLVKTPILINSAELDPVYSGDLKKVWEEALNATCLDKRSKVYPNTVHGFGCRPDLNDAQVKESFKTALTTTMQFFTDKLQ